MHDDFTPPEKLTASEQLAQALLEDRKKERRSKNIRFGFIVLSILAYIFVIASISAPSNGGFDESKPYATLVELKGEISAGGDISFKKVSPLLTKAFEDEQAKGVVLVVNSPGGSPVQSAMIYDRIRFLKEKHQKTVIVVAEDTVASGGYFIAAAADKIYVNQSTIIGSIGVISRSFGLVELMEKVGVESRTLTSGEAKNRLDPFTTPTEEDKQKIKSVMANIHTHFITAVKEGRGNRIKSDDSKTFNGDFWTGTEAVEMGLADKVGDLYTALDQEFAVQNFKGLAHKKSPLADLTSLLGASIGSSLANQIQSNFNASTVTPELR